jgi:hypothetical protein
MKQPEALRLYTNQFLDHEGNPNGVHLGCNDLEVCKQSHVPGELSTVIHEWVDAAELRRLDSEHEEDQRVIAVWRGRTQRAEAQSDALLAALEFIVRSTESSKRLRPLNLYCRQVLKDCAANRAVKERPAG